MPWELTGNPGINPTINFLGTTDNEPLIIKTNGAERLRIDSTGHVSIGTAGPRPVFHPGTLTVAGLIHSTAEGIKFPDGSIQITATLQGPQGPQGPQGAPGVAHTSAVCGPLPCYEACSHVLAGQQASLDGTIPCYVTSDTRYCFSTVASEWCCVCY